ncbi:unnamed protein product [Notodromas monacha]|uniref:Carbonic anhydrase n=1 Tax=Notodromas monacha TaxID=399045 RepID=A0A7R9GD91_9CRUS|nr:unnamed protein product [Notodromas monacha]CAG0916684.1 unnamed protein product [Notodromas monacha]
MSGMTMRSFLSFFAFALLLLAHVRAQQEEDYYDDDEQESVATEDLPQDDVDDYRVPAPSLPDVSDLSRVSPLKLNKRQVVQRSEKQPVVITPQAVIKKIDHNKDEDEESHSNKGDHQSHWGYGDAAAFEEWAAMFGTCGGPRQSPIDIDTGHVSFTNYDNWRFQGYEQEPDLAIISNNGHSATLHTENVEKFLHFHWGARSIHGSEHTVNERRFPLELHLVHFSTAYPNVSAAVASGRGDALAVLGFLYEISTRDPPGGLGAVVAALPRVTSSASTAQLPQPTAPSLASLVQGLDLARFFRYDGSLTTPPCSEVVVWTVFEDKLGISEAQLQAFRRVTSDDGHSPLVDNYRPVQKQPRQVSYNNARQSFVLNPSFASLYSFGRKTASSSSPANAGSPISAALFAVLIFAIKFATEY